MADFAPIPGTPFERFIAAATDVQTVLEALFGKGLFPRVDFIESAADKLTAVQGELEAQGYQVPTIERAADPIGFLMAGHGFLRAVAPSVTLQEMGRVLTDTTDQLAWLYGYTRGHSDLPRLSGLDAADRVDFDEITGSAVWNVRWLHGVLKSDGYLVPETEWDEDPMGFVDANLRFLCDVHAFATHPTWGFPVSVPGRRHDG